MANSWVMHRSHHKADANFAQRLFDHIRANHDVHAHLAKRVRRAG